MASQASTDRPRADAAPPRWALLVYTVPATPSRKRAAVWREVKRLGALYLRDGVCALPDTPPARAGFEALAARVQAFDGQATVVWEAMLSPATAQSLREDIRHAREAEYAEVADAVAVLHRHLEQEAAHHAFGRGELAGLNGDLGRLHRWLDQIVGRDYLLDGDPGPIVAALAACRKMLAEQTAGVA